MMSEDHKSSASGGTSQSDAAVSGPREDSPDDLRRELAELQTRFESDLEGSSAGERRAAGYAFASVEGRLRAIEDTDAYIDACRQARQVEDDLAKEAAHIASEREPTELVQTVGRVLDDLEAYVRSQGPGRSTPEGAYVTDQEVGENSEGDPEWYLQGVPRRRLVEAVFVLNEGLGKGLATREERAATALFERAEWIELRLDALDIAAAAMRQLKSVPRYFDPANSVEKIQLVLELVHGERPRTRVRERIPTEVRGAVWDRDHGVCVQCGATSDLQYDHILPWSKGGSATVENLQVLCAACNRRKGASI
jgi:hypothetical protein